MKPDHAPNIPVYQRIANVLRARIVGLKHDCPVHLATEHQLSEIHSASRDTIRRALAVLEAEGLIQRAPKRGTLTAPAGIAAWLQRRHARQIVVAATRTSTPDVPLRFYGRVLQGILTRAEAVGYSVSFREYRQIPEAAPSSQSPEGLDEALGAILLDIRDDRLVDAYARTGCPVVVVDHLSQDPRVDAVVVDCFNEGQRVADLFIEGGHRHMFFVGNAHRTLAQQTHELDADLLLAGMQRKLSLVGMSPPASHIFFCRQHPQEIEEVVQRVAELHPRPTAGMIFSSETCRLFMRGMASRGVSCPGDIALVCKAYTGEEIKVAALRVDAEAMGQRAVDQLVNRASGQRTAPERILQTSTFRPGPSFRPLHRR